MRDLCEMMPLASNMFVSILYAIEEVERRYTYTKSQWEFQTNLAIIHEAMSVVDGFLIFDLIMSVAAEIKAAFSRNTV